MINHIVLLKFKTRITEGRIAEVLQQLGNLMGIIPAIKNFSLEKRQP